MAYDNTHLVKLAALKALAEKVKSDYALKTELSALSTKVDGLITAGGEPNKLEGVKVNGTALAIAEKMVDILIATGSANGTISVNKVDVAIKGLAALAFKAKVSQDDLDEALAAVLAGKADSATTLAGYGITDAYHAAHTSDRAATTSRSTTKTRERRYCGGKTRRRARRSKITSPARSSSRKRLCSPESSSA